MWLQFVGAVGGLLAALAAVVSAGLIATRRSRVSRSEVFWRNILVNSGHVPQSEPALILARKLHRSSIAELISLELVPPRRLGLALLLITFSISQSAWVGWTTSEFVRGSGVRSIATYLKLFGSPSVLEFTMSIFAYVGVAFLGVGSLFGYISARLDIRRRVASDEYPLEVPVGFILVGSPMAFLTRARSARARIGLLPIAVLAILLSCATASAGTLAGEIHWIRSEGDRIDQMQQGATLPMLAAFGLATSLVAVILITSRIYPTKLLETDLPIVFSGIEDLTKKEAGRSVSKQIGKQFPSPHDLAIVASVLGVRLSSRVRRSQNGD